MNIVNKEYVNDKLVKVLSNIENECLGADFYWYSYCDGIDETLRKCGEQEKVGVFCGKSKVCFVDDCWDYVFKLPLFGEKEIEQEYDEEYGEYIEIGETTYENDNFLEKDLEKFEEAVENGMSDIFAKNIWVGTIDVAGTGIDVYVQKKCLEFWSGKTASSKEAMKEATSYSDKHYSAFNVIWIANVIDFYGFEKGMKLIKYLEDNIGDLHDGNYGYAVGGQPVIFDYSGWWRGEEYYNSFAA